MGLLASLGKRYEPDKFSSDIKNEYGNGHQKFYEHAAKSIIDPSSDFIDGKEGLKSLELLSAMYKSAREGRVVPLPLSYSRMVSSKNKFIHHTSQVTKTLKLVPKPLFGIFATYPLMLKSETMCPSDKMCL